MTIDRFIALLRRGTGRLGVQVMGKTNIALAQRYVELRKCPSMEFKVRQILYELLEGDGMIVNLEAWNSLASAETANGMVFIPDEDYPYEHIAGGKKYQSLRHARASAKLDFAEWFPDCDPRNGVSVSHYEDGAGLLTATGYTEDGELFSTHIEFKDFRPIKRISDREHAKMEMFPT
jgi:hypothetical protein